MLGGLSKVKLKIFYFILLATCFCSCRSYTDYKTVAGKSVTNLDTIIVAKARNGVEDYLSIEIQIKRSDSLFVKDIFVKPILKKGTFPDLYRYIMFSYYIETEGISKNKIFWKDYSAKLFSELPMENRKTNKGNSFVTYKIIYKSQKKIRIKEFSADIEVVLLDTNGKEVICKRHFDYKGKKHCYLAVH